MKVSKCPSDVLTMTNRAIVSPADFDPKVILNGIFTTVQLNKVIVYRVLMNANPLLRNGPGTIQGYLQRMRLQRREEFILSVSLNYMIPCNYKLTKQYKN